MKKNLLLLTCLLLLLPAASRSQWLNQYCTTCSQGCYINGGMITPTSGPIQYKSTYTTPNNYGYVYWSFAATAGTTYYFDLCTSTGTSATSRLRLHNARNTSPNNNYCMNGNSTPTLILENTANGCAGTGTGLSKLIWTCTTSGTYYLESCSDDIDQYWGVATNQSAILGYKTLPSSSTGCADVFYDKGGDGTNGSFWNYNNNEDWLYTYYPDMAGNKINAQFISFNTYGGDVLSIYNGNSTAAPLLGSFAGSTLPGVFTSSAADGSLTFHFTSDDAGTLDGWEANISCVSALEVKRNSWLNRISIFPNPVINRLVINTSLPEKVNLEIRNMIGEKVNGWSYAPSANASQLTIDASALPAGIYFVKIFPKENKEHSTWMGRFVKE